MEENQEEIPKKKASQHERKEKVKTEPEVGDHVIYHDAITGSKNALVTELLVRSEQKITVAVVLQAGDTGKITFAKVLHMNTGPSPGPYWRWPGEVDRIERDADCLGETSSKV